MKEIPFLPEHAAGLCGRRLAHCLQDRLPRLAAIAGQLAKAGWDIRLTISGLAVAPPSAGGADDDEDLERQLKELGVTEAVSGSPSRTLEAVIEAEGEYQDRATYEHLDRQLRGLGQPVCPCCTDLVEEQLRELEARYGRRNLSVADEYERGVLHGRWEGLQWVLGDDWQDLEEYRARRRLIAHVTVVAASGDEDDDEDPEDGLDDGDAAGERE